MTRLIGWVRARWPWRRYRFEPPIIRTPFWGGLLDGCVAELTPEDWLRFAKHGLHLGGGVYCYDLMHDRFMWREIPEITGHMKSTWRDAA